MEVMFWVLFARDNMYKPQSEVPSTAAAAKIEKTLKRAGLNLIQELTQLQYVVHPKMCSPRDTTRLHSDSHVLESSTVATLHKCACNTESQTLSTTVRFSFNLANLI